VDELILTTDMYSWMGNQGFPARYRLHRIGVRS